jgi:transcription antitermination protein NusB
MSKPHSQSRSASRLAAVQALYQQAMESTPLAVLLHEFHQHRLGATIEGETYVNADVDFFDDLVMGVDARREEIDGLIAGNLSEGWSFNRLDKPLTQILRAGTYELLARPDVPTGAVIDEYLDVAAAFFEQRDKAFVNGILDKVARQVRR